MTQRHRGKSAARGVAPKLALAAGLALSAGAARADGWLFSGAEIGDGFLALVYFEQGESAPLSLTCAWRRDGEMAPIHMGDMEFEGVSPTTPGELRLEISTEIAGGYGEEAPELEIRIGDSVFDGFEFQGDVIGYVYTVSVPQQGPLLQALMQGEAVELRSSLAPEWTAPLDERAHSALAQLQEFCSRREAGAEQG